MEKEIIFENVPCPVSKALDKISGKWKILALYYLSKRPYRFLELQRQMYGISKGVLSTVLNELIQDGFLTKIDFNENPPHTEYQLTEYGETLMPILDAIKEWSDNFG